MSEFVILRRYLDPIEAHLDRTRLEGEDLDVQVIETMQSNPHVVGAAGGVTLGVRARDVERAEAILAAPGPDPIEEDDEDDGAVVVRCPRCEGEYCSFERSRGLSTSTVLNVVTLPLLLFGPKRWHCDRCEHVWDDPQAGPKRVTRLEPEDPRPVFRLRRAHPGLGRLVGLTLGLVPAALIAGVVLRAAGAAPAILVGLAAWVAMGALGRSLGAAVGADVCSGPKCRAPLLPGVETCPACKGSLAGRVTSAAEHFAAAADFRRDLVALRARDEARVERKAKKKARRSPG